ncbi:MAG: DinB family protein [Planctomycetota bacterium]
MARWPWIERTFVFDFPPEKFPDLLKRCRGTPLRVDGLVANLEPACLTWSGGNGWSIQENVGHLVDLGYLPMTRIEEILSGGEVLTAADMSNRQTNQANQANHHACSMDSLLARFHEERGGLVERLMQLDPSDWGRAALHPRLQQPMRIVDIVCFDSEHDDYHLARMRELRDAWQARAS